MCVCATAAPQSTMLTMTMMAMMMTVMMMMFAIPVYRLVPLRGLPKNESVLSKVKCLNFIKTFPSAMFGIPPTVPFGSVLLGSRWFPEHAGGWATLICWTHLAPEPNAVLYNWLHCAIAQLAELHLSWGRARFSLPSCKRRMGCRMLRSRIPSLVLLHLEHFFLALTAWDTLAAARLHPTPEPERHTASILLHTEIIAHY